MKIASVVALWKANKKRWWGCGEEDKALTLEQLYKDYFDSSALDAKVAAARERMDWNYAQDVKYHRDSVKYALELLHLGTMPPLELDGKTSIEDGHHRLVACKIMNLKKVPVRRTNPDNRLRRLERAAASGDVEDVKAYWRALLQTGQMPKGEPGLAGFPSGAQRPLKTLSWTTYRGGDYDFRVTLYDPIYANDRWLVSWHMGGSYGFTLNNETFETSEEAMERIREIITDYVHG